MFEQQETPVEFYPPPEKSRRWPWVLAVLAGLFAFFYIARPVIIWCGGAHRTIRVSVTDNDDGHPIRGAAVSLITSRDQEYLESMSLAQRTDLLQHYKKLATTDESGGAFVTGDFGAGGTHGYFSESGSFTVNGVLKISHPDYHPSEDLLQNRLGERKFSIDKKQLDVRVYLVPKKSKWPSQKVAD